MTTNSEQPTEKTAEHECKFFFDDESVVYYCCRCGKLEVSGKEYYSRKLMQAYAYQQVNAKLDEAIAQFLEWTGDLNGLAYIDRLESLKIKQP